MVIGRIAECDRDFREVVLEITISPWIAVVRPADVPPDFPEIPGDTEKAIELDGCLVVIVKIDVGAPEAGVGIEVVKPDFCAVGNAALQGWLSIGVGNPVIDIVRKERDLGGKFSGKPGISSSASAMIFGSAASSVVSGMSSAVLAGDESCGDFVPVGEEWSFAEALPIATKVVSANAGKRQSGTRHITQAP